MEREPVAIAGGIVAAIISIATFAVAIGWISWNGEQMNAFKALLAACVPLIVSAIGIYVARSKAYSPETVAEIQAEGNLNGKATT